ncbi:MAG: hypothetical protein HYW12_08440 [Planctomycetes bacterium]|uniref:hypothetical protein n=1 Tax=Candidatus Wujingus californicus TaxID=3367618 RepID=UPI001E16370D|nr:hypothetical protein [Planctomycetota bacterium]
MTKAGTCKFLTGLCCEIVVIKYYVTVHPHLNLPHQGGGIQGDNEYSPPLVGGVRGGGELLQYYKGLTDNLNITAFLDILFCRR